MSGYQDCGCRDCFEIAIGDGEPALCHSCEEAGCDVEGGSECEADHGHDEDCEHHLERRHDREDFHADC